MKRGSPNGTPKALPPLAPLTVREYLDLRQIGAPTFDAGIPLLGGWYSFVSNKITLGVTQSTILSWAIWRALGDTTTIVVNEGPTPVRLMIVREIGTLRGPDVLAAGAGVLIQPGTTFEARVQGGGDRLIWLAAAEPVAPNPAAQSIIQLAAASGQLYGIERVSVPSPSP